MSKVKNFKLNRKKYQKIKKMDHNQMEVYIESIYQAGYQSGLKERSGLTPQDVKSVLLDIKGIGQRKAETISEALERYISEN